MLMQKMEGIGREALLKAVDIANAAGNPTYDKVEEILFIGLNRSFETEDKDDAADTNDEFYVEQRNPMSYIGFIDDGVNDLQDNCTGQND